ncbi:DNA repair protein RecN [bacterium]|nr:DNA repair protein RecN [bacterium]MCP5462990.1 DNA repair protein RecN [bacterium]
MLRELKIHNLVLVKDAHIHFSDGLNIITGETGAGKSVIIGSLNLIIGQRASSSIIRQGEETCSVEAVLDISGNMRAQVFLENSGIDAEDKIVYIKREIARNGANRQYINASPVPLNVLEKLGAICIDIHGQHDHQSLFSIDAHRHFLDWYSGIKIDLETYKKDFTDWQNVSGQLDDIHAQIEKNQHDRKLWKYELEELNQAELQYGEEETLEQEYHLLSNAKEIKERAMNIYDALYNAEDSLHDHACILQRNFTELSRLDSFFEEYNNSFEQIHSIIEDTAQACRVRNEQVDCNDERLEEVEKRIAFLEKLKRKFNLSINKLLEYKAELENRLQTEQELDVRLVLLESNQKELYDRLLKNAARISSSRSLGAERLKKHIKSEFIQLALPDAEIDIEIKHSEQPGPSGMDIVEFLFSGNKGERCAPLRKVASGGEVSRIMLALKSTFADADNISVMVFDEIDVNLGGAAAREVGKRLRVLAGSHQILCITHLPQIASLGKTHFKVEKSFDKDRTYTHITALSAENRIEEIARMLGGKDITSVTKIHAKELIEHV